MCFENQLSLVGFSVEESVVVNVPWHPDTREIEVGNYRCKSVIYLVYLFLNCALTELYLLTDWKYNSQTQFTRNKLSARKYNNTKPMPL